MTCREEYPPPEAASGARGASKLSVERGAETVEYSRAIIGLDLNRYRILAKLPHKGLWIIYQASETEYLPYCVQYAGSGRYFSSLSEMNMYTLRRWRVCVTEAGRVERYRRPLLFGR